ncbi:MAG: L-aspartate oxidase [Candidatus Pacebacteria bacterium]|nr:L-aspartate oxidase [Candidatus Paceibacterota bacterium]
MDEKITTEVLVIGSGIAGCTAALELADAGVEVVLVTRAANPTDSNTYSAQGGIIYKGEGDSAEKLASDIIVAGAGLSNEVAVGIVSKEGPRTVEKFLINRVGVDFDKIDGELSRTKEGGQKINRIIHHADETGRAIEEAMAAQVAKHPKIKVITNATAVDLLTPAHHSTNRIAVYEPLSCAGVYLLDRQTGCVSRCLAKQTVLATGGLGQVYEFTTNPDGARGDGIAMADRAGARTINLEYVQFHPTAFYHPNAPRLLITEAARGEGARLVDAAGKPFMQDYDPRADLATRDVVARSIYHQMLATGAGNVYLDMKSYIPQEKISRRFPNIRKTLLGFGVDILKEPIPVVPAAHYSCGGVYVDAKTGETTIKNLYAVGEVACTGLHGANRLASTSLLEGLVYGEIVAGVIKGQIGGTKVAANIKPWEYLGNPEADPSLVAQDLRNIRGIMWNYVGLERTTARLARARLELGHAQRSVEQFYQNSKVNDALLGLRNIARTAVLIAEAAWANKQSAGSHYRTG